MSDRHPGQASNSDSPVLSAGYFEWELLLRGEVSQGRLDKDLLPAAASAQVRSVRAIRLDSPVSWYTPHARPAQSCRSGRSEPPCCAPVRLAVGVPSVVVMSLPSSNAVPGPTTRASSRRPPVSGPAWSSTR